MFVGIQIQNSKFFKIQNSKDILFEQRLIVFPLALINLLFSKNELKILFLTN